MAGIQDYLESLPEAVLARLFRSPPSVLAILRMLPPLAKYLVLRMAFNAEHAVALERIEQWVKPGRGRVQAEALASLRSLHIVREIFATKSIQINAAFAGSLRSALTAGPVNQAEPRELSGHPTLPPEFLAKYSMQKWESILHFMVGSTSHLPLSDRPPSETILALLRKSGLMFGPTAHRIHITSEGFQFLLQSRAAQVWTLLLHYLTLAGKDPVEILDFIFTLGTLEIGTPYTLATKVHSHILEDLAELGIVYRPENGSDGSDVFYPAVMLAQPGKDAAAVVAASTPSNAESDSYIILETNYRLYAYTDSPLQISILNLFCRLHSRFSNLVIGRITRESVRRALHNGITADQLIEFLEVHAHPELRAHGGLPPTISDQIKLWQLELDRFRHADGFLFRDFAGAREYTLIVSYAQDVGAVLWRNDRRRMFFVDSGSSQQVLEYINRKMDDATSG